MTIKKKKCGQFLHCCVGSVLFKSERLLMNFPGVTMTRSGNRVRLSPPDTYSCLPDPSPAHNKGSPGSEGWTLVRPAPVWGLMSPT